MPSTVFSAGTVIQADWLNEINQGVLQPSLKSLIGGLTIPDFTIDTTTTNDYVFFTNTNPLDWADGPGKMSVEFELIPTGYFAANPNGHFSIVLRQDPAVVGTAIRGQGVAVGNLTASVQNSDLNPTPLLETWFNGTGGDAYLWSNSEAARSHGGLQDGTRYKFLIESTKTVDDNRYLRYRLWSYQATDGNWQAEVDTGDVLDHNPGADLTKTGLLFLQVFEDNLSPWSLPFTDIKVTWGPADLAVPDQTTKLSRYGAQLEGDLTFIDTARRVYAPFGGGSTSLVNYLTVQSSTTNTATSFVVKPNGTATSANTLYSNNATSTTVWQGVSVGMTSTEALIESLAIGASTLPVGINVGSGSRIATFKTTGINVLSASKDIGALIGWSGTLTNWGGTNAATFSTTANLNVDALSTSGTIATYLTGTYSAALIEDMVRPLWCMLSFLVKNLQDKKVI